MRWERGIKKRLLERFNSLEVLNINGKLVSCKLRDEYLEIGRLLDTQQHSFLRDIEKELDKEAVSQ